MSTHKRLLLVFSLTFAGLLPSRAAQAQSAEELVPFAKLPVTVRKKAWLVCKRYTVRRRVKERSVKCSPKTYSYLLKNVHQASILVRALKLGTFKITRSKGVFAVDDQKGAFANCKPVFEEPGRMVLFADGEIEGRLLPKVTGQAVIIIRYKKDSSKAGTILSDCRIYFRLNDKFLRRATKAFRKILSRLMEDKLKGLAECAALVAERVETQASKLYKLLKASKESEKADLAAFRKAFLKSGPAPSTKPEKAKAD